MKVVLVCGARPNFMKVAPLYREMQAREGIEPFLVHTGQHFDKEMSADFIESLELPTPDAHLEVGPGSQAWQIAEIMKATEQVVHGVGPDVTVVVGDVSSTLAAALASATLDVPVAHVEAGLRSRDWSMPEERNRVLTDRLSRYLFTPSPDAEENLRKEAIDEDRIFPVGNVMIDSLDWVLPRLSQAEARASAGVGAGPFGLVTLHRPANVDDPGVLKGIVSALRRVGEHVPLLFPVHPRTRQRLDAFGLDLAGPGVKLLPPLAYDRFLALLAGASLVLTDSGGIQEETTVLGVPCLTLRHNTERPTTLEYGVNVLVGADEERILQTALDQLSRPRPEARRPPLWDGNTAGRVVDVLMAGA